MKESALFALAFVALNSIGWAQQPTPPPAIVSPEVQADRHVTFRINAPMAQNVRLTGSDIPGLLQGAPMTKGENGVWEVTLGPIDPGAYRYNFNVDRVSVIDPRNPSISESNNNVWSMVYIPGADFMDTKEVPHGAVSAVTYYSTVLKKYRRMHVYTPPGYESGSGKYPVFYLLHGAGDCDESWTSVGRAGFIMDNLIAAKKAKPMVIVMPAGHTAQTGGLIGAAGSQDDFIAEFSADIMPYAESHYRVQTDRQHRAIAGLSMGGTQTLGIAIPHLEQFAYIGVFSSGLIGGLLPGSGAGSAATTATTTTGTSATTTASSTTSWEEQHRAQLDNAAARKGLKLVWFSTGSDDRLITTSRSTVDMLKAHGFNAQFKESPGAHTWINWRNYLNEFAPQLFQ